MATSEHEIPMKDKVADPDEQIKDKGNEIKDVKNAGGAEAVTTEAIAVEEDNKKNDAKTKEPVVENKGKEAHEAEVKKDDLLEKAQLKAKGAIDEAVKEEKKNNQEKKPADDQVEKADASDRKIAEKSSSMETKEKSEEAHKNKDVVEEVVKEAKKKIEAEPREIAVENKKQAADQTEKKKDEPEKNDTSELNKVEKSSSMAAKENAKEPQMVKEKVVNEDKKKIEVEPIKETVMENKGKQVDETEKKTDEVDKTDASKKMSSLATKEKLEDAQKDKGVVEKVVKEDKPKIEAESRETVVDTKGTQDDQAEKKKDDQAEKKKDDQVEKKKDDQAEKKKDDQAVERDDQAEKKKDDQAEKKKDESEKADVSKFTNEKKLEEAKKDQGAIDMVVEEDKKKKELKPGELVVEDKGKEVDKTEKKKDEVEKVDASTRKITEKSSSMATEEKLEETLKNKGGVEGVVKEENKIEAKPKEVVVENKEKEDVQLDKKKDEIQTTKEPKMDAVIVEEKVNEEKKKIDEKPSETVVENKGNEVDKSKNKKDELEKTTASKGTNVEKSSSTAKEEKLEEAKKIEVEPKEIVVENKGKKDDIIENKKVEVEKADASKCTEVENSLSMATEEKLEETMKDVSTVEEVTKKEEKNIEAEPIEIVVDNKVKGETVEEVSLKEEKEDGHVGNGGASESGVVEKCVSLKEEKTSLLDLKEHEKKALEELRSKIEKAIHENKETSQEVDDAEAAKQEDEEKDKNVAKVDFSINEDVAIWGVPLLPSKDDDATNVVLLKFLKAKDFEVNNAFEMLWNTLKWRKENNIDWILDENFGDDLSSIGIMTGVSREGHPVYYSSFKLFGNEELYNKVLGTEEKRDRFIRSRIQLMERAIMKLDFKSGGVSSIFLVNDCKDMPGPSKKELRNAIKQILTLHQDNYPEFVAKHIFINVPFWYYAFSASTFLSPFLTPKSNSKFVFARPAKVNETLLKYIALEELPASYGGFKRENDPDFGTEDVLTEISINQSSTEIIRIPIAEAGGTIMWEVIVFGWEVTYKEEFSPASDGSDSVVIQKGRKISGQEGSIRNCFTSEEPGTILLTIENPALIKKKRIYYRYKIKDHGTS